jgi:hypothetical protein
MSQQAPTRTVFLSKAPAVSGEVSDCAAETLRAKEDEMADLTLQELLDATDAVLGDDGGKHRLDDKARAVVLERDRLRNLHLAVRASSYYMESK